MARRGKLRLESKKKLDALKFEICLVLDYDIHLTCRELQISKKALAVHLGTSEANLSRIGNKRLDQLTFNQLFRYLVILRPDVRMLISTH